MSQSRRLETCRCGPAGLGRGRGTQGAKAMFTGIITDIGTIAELEDRGDLRARIRAAAAELM